MKKYLASLIPFLFCTILSVIYGAKSPKQFPDHSYPYQTKETLSSLSSGWLFVGIVISGVFICIFIISDVVDFVAKGMEKRKRR